MFMPLYIFQTTLFMLGMTLHASGSPTRPGVKY